MKKQLICLILMLVAVKYQNSNAATVTVVNLNDNGLGSLRWAIETAASGDIINFSLTGTIVLDSVISWNKSLIILGPETNDLIIDGHNTTNIFYIPGGRNLIRRISFTNGFSEIGGCINVPPGSTADTTIIENCRFSNSTATEAGGAVSCLNGRYLVMRSCTVDSCSSSSNLGGGIVAYYGTILENSTFSNCSALSNGGGAWIVNNVSTITNCSFVNNQSISYKGGAIYFQGNSTVLLMNNTFSGNTALYSGSAFYVQGDRYDHYYIPVMTYQNNIFDSPAGNFAQDPDVASISNGGNISNDSTMIAFLISANDMNNTDPQLDITGLQNNGGSINTIALNASSPAINNGISEDAPLLDERGYQRIGLPDAGAYELGAITSIGNYVNNSDMALSIFPNPSDGNITVHYSKAVDNGLLEIFDKLGREIYSKRFEGDINGQQEIRLSASAGLYFVRVSDEGTNNTRSFTKPFLIR